MPFSIPPLQAMAPMTKAVAVDLSTADYVSPAAARLYVGGMGTLVVVLADDTAPVAYASFAGWLPCWVRTVVRAGTTATGIVAHPV